MIKNIIFFLKRKFKFKKSKCVSVLYLHGVIGSSGAFSGKGELNLKSIKSNIDRAFSNKNNKAVILSINSPGGSPVQSELICNYIRLQSKKYNVPTISYVEDVAASGGYWLACSSPEIYCSENSIVGSIGVISAGFGFVEAIKKLGVERRVIAQGENKSIYDPFKPVAEKDKKIIQAIQKDIHESFIEHVRSSRGDKLSGSKQKLFNGDFWTGKNAVKLGLVDQIAGMYEMIYERFGENTKICCIQEQKSFIKKLLKIDFSTDRMVNAIFKKIKYEIINNRYNV